MKITKSRLLEIIKEEVALFNHSKQKQELYEFNMVDLVEMLDEKTADKDGDNKLSDEEQKAVINKEVEKDKAVGNLPSKKEEVIFDPKTKKELKPKK